MCNVLTFKISIYQLLQLPTASCLNGLLCRSYPPFHTNQPTLSHFPPKIHIHSLKPSLPPFTLPPELHYHIYSYAIGNRFYMYLSLIPLPRLNSFRVSVSSSMCAIHTISTPTPPQSWVITIISGYACPRLLPPVFSLHNRWTTRMIGRFMCRFH